MHLTVPYQRVERRDREDSQTAQHHFRRPPGGGQQALRVGELSALQTSQVTAHAEELEVELLQVLFPL